MITLVDVTRMVDTPGGPHPILLAVSTHFGACERVGILVPAGQGKSTIARMLCGIEKPTRGKIIRAGTVSWPLGFAGAFHPDLTVRQNITALSELVGEGPNSQLAFCLELGRLHAFLDQPMKLVSPGVRLAVAFSFSLSVQRDYYVADETIGFGENEVRKRSEAMLEERLGSAGLIFLSRNPNQLAKHCNRFLVLLSGKLVACSSPQIGAKALSLVEHGSDQSVTIAEDVLEEADFR